MIPKLLKTRSLACWAFVVTAMLSGCACGPRTTVVLLPDEDGHVGAVVVADGGGQQRISEAFNAVTVDDPRSMPSQAKPKEKQSIEQQYGALLKAQPTKPLTFTLYFVLDSVALTEQSKALVPEMIKAAKDRKPTEITVYGHADASGTEERNEHLSELRARVVAELLRKSDAEFAQVQVEYFGDRSPLVPNDGHKPEPKNRRAEVVIL
ncbi:MAG TPA: OmpA family protein [Burkholderiaceae bacterium]